MATICIPGLRHLADDRRRFGFSKAVSGLVYRAAQRLIKLRINEFMWRPMIGIDVLKVRPKLKGLEFRPLTPDEVREYAQDTAYELADSMAERLERGSDWCFAAFLGDRLVNYSWYALGSIEGQHCHVPISFPANMVYLYKAFTHPEFRGAGIHQATFIEASKRLARLGIEQFGLIVEYANWDSLRSHERLGFQPLGQIVTAGRGSYRFERHPRHGERLGLRFGSAADLSGRLADSGGGLPGKPRSAEHFTTRQGFAQLAAPACEPAFVSLSDFCPHDCLETTN